MKKSYTFYFALLMSLMVFLSIETGWAQQATFNFTNNAQSFMVPNGVFSIHIQAWGAEGGTVVTGGGLGGFAEGDLAVTPGQILNIFVGGRGCIQIQGFGCGGFNGGGNAFDNTNTPVFGGGGGASDVRVGGVNLTGRVIVAAGGGGDCASDFPGGNGGGLVGVNGGGGNFGRGGTQTTGGAGFPPCEPGVRGLGGNSNLLVTCAGGGGGWFGGGSGCGAGGGSSYIDGVINGNTSTGVRDGDGMVVLTVIGINLSPTTATNDVFTNHLVIATLEIPEPNVLVTFEVISGPNAGLVSIPNNGECTPNDCTTDANGQVSWTYSSVIPGTDIIVASFTDQAGQVLESDLAEKIWEILPQFISLSPTTATNDVGTDHTITATVDTDGVPEPDVLVAFEVISGPNAGLVSIPNNGECTPNDDCTTDGNGQVSWTYTGSRFPGTDTILASFFDEQLQMIIESDPIEKIWIALLIPTLSEWGLIALATILGIVGFIVVRRRKLVA